MTAPQTTQDALAGLDIRYLPINSVHESPLNTRTHFDPVKLQELADSMKASKQLTPVLVRPSKLKGKAGFELAAGHRRRRAAAIAGLDTLLAIVRDLDDRTFLEILTVDNLQREDVHPLEEAQGYKNLLTLEGYNQKLIAERVGKTEAYVYDRLKLLQLIPEAKKLFFAHRFSLGHAVLLARLDKDDQKHCLSIDEKRNGGRGGMWTSEGNAHAPLGFDDPSGIENDFDGRLKPVSVRELQAWIDNHVRFAKPDPTLPHLFPETAANLAAAEKAKAKVIQISRDHQLQDDAKDPDGKRTYCTTSWKRADGQVEAEDWWNTKDLERAKPSLTCEYSVLGVVVAGHGRGESFRVCTDKKRCTTHWADEIKARNQRERAREKADASPSTAKAEKPSENSWERKEQLRKEATKLAVARWAKGGDAVLRAMAPHVKKLAVGGKTPATKYFLDVINDGLYGIGGTGKSAEKLGVPFGSTPAELIRHLIMVALIDRASPDRYNATNETDLQEDLDLLKIKVDVVKLLDAASPPPKPEPKKEAPKAAAKKVAPKVKPTAPKKASVAKGAKKATKRAAKKRPTADFMKPKQPDAVLAVIVGDTPQPRTEITKRLWTYIKKNGLQDAKERRMINSDDKLKAVFGGKKQVSMFEMTKLVNKHIKP